MPDVRRVSSALAPAVGVLPQDRQAAIGAGGAGVLHSLPKPSARYKINATLIESRPSRRKNRDCMFSLDLDGHAEEASLADALADLERISSLFRVLGAYPKAVN